MAPVSYIRDIRKPPAEWDKRGEELFSAVYRDTAPSVQGLLDAAYPDLGQPSFFFSPSQPLYPHA